MSLVASLVSKSAMRNWLGTSGMPTCAGTKPTSTRLEISASAIDNRAMRAVTDRRMARPNRPPIECESGSDGIGGKPVAGAPHRVEDRRGEAVLEFATQTADMDVDDVRARIEVIIPDLLEHHRPRDDLSGMAGEEFEQVEFARAERDVAAGAGDVAGEQVDLEIADRELGLRRLGGDAVAAADQRLDPRGQFGEGEGLAEIIVG